MEGCRDAPELLDPPGLEPLGPAPYQLTYDPGREVAPAWSASGDSVIYSTERLLPPGSTGADTIRIGRPLKVIHREGGTAQHVFPQLQTSADGTIPIDHASQSPDGRVAAFTLLPPLPALACGNVGVVVTCVPALAAEAPPRLDRGLLRVREPNSLTAPAADPRFEVAFQGRAFDTSQNPAGLDGVWQIEVHPFQRQFNVDRRAPDRISWSPEGDRAVFSDGVSLRVWNPSTGDVVPLPGGEDGVNPAWSPTGEWIAFERYARGVQEDGVCEYRQGDETGPLLCMEQRRTWPTLGRAIALVHPDGGEPRILTEGSRPAWGSGQRVYYERDRRIWSVDINGGDATPVPSTEEGFQPAVSPDGRWLAFARFDALSSASDIWIVELEP
jgi:dipeptidyl aminopeptidase/acylaminoacyl peptidase